MYSEVCTLSTSNCRLSSLCIRRYRLINSTPTRLIHKRELQTTSRLDVECATRTPTRCDDGKVFQRIFLLIKRAYRNLLRVIAGCLSLCIRRYCLINSTPTQLIPKRELQTTSRLDVECATRTPTRCDDGKVFQRKFLLINRAYGTLLRVTARCLSLCIRR